MRFPNEVTAIRNAGGGIVWIQRGSLPEWYHCALTENTTPWDRQWLLEDAKELMEQKFPSVHKSEWAWVGTNFDALVDNNGSVEDLYTQLKNLLPEDSPAK